MIFPADISDWYIGRKYQQNFFYLMRSIRTFLSCYQPIPMLYWYCASPEFAYSVWIKPLTDFQHKSSQFCSIHCTGCRTLSKPWCDILPPILSSVLLFGSHISLWTDDWWSPPASDLFLLVFWSPPSSYQRKAEAFPVGTLYLNVSPSDLIFLSEVSGSFKEQTHTGRVLTS